MRMFLFNGMAGGNVKVWHVESSLFDGGYTPRQSITRNLKGVHVCSLV